MAAALVCATIAVSLMIAPPRSQFFSIERFVVTCPSDSWTVWRNSTGPSSCAPPWGTPRAGGCRVGPTMPSDTGWYWCQNKQECTRPVHVTVTGKSVILESPLFPVMEGITVTLNCSYKRTDIDDPSSNFSAKFFKDGVFIGSYPEGKLVILSASKKDEGLYKCEHPTKHQSLESLLVVQDGAKPSTTLSTSPTPPDPPMIPLPRLLCFVGLFILYTIILFISISVYLKWARARADEKQQNSERLSLRRINPRDDP